MNLRFLETFVWVARLRSFSLAADKLATTQASVSNRIATLERDLGVRLFERDLRNVSLTAHGQRALPQAEAIVGMAAEFERSVSAPDHLRGSIRIGAADSIVYAWLPELIENLKGAYPNVALDLTVDTSLSLAEQIQDGRLDLAFAMGPVVAPHIRNVSLGAYECVWVGSPRFGLPAGRIEVADLAQTPIFAFSKGSQPHQAVERAMEKAGVNPAVARIFHSNSLATMTKLLRDGVAIAVMPWVVVREFLASGELVVLNVAASLPPLHFHAVYTDDPTNKLPALIAEMAVQTASKFQPPKPGFGISDA